MSGRCGASLAGLTKRFGETTVLRGIDLCVEPGECVAVIGPSGTGKSTLLRCWNFLERAQAGRVQIGDLSVDAAAANDYLTAALRTVRTHLGRVRRLARDNPERLAASVAEHRVIADAIAAGDPELAAHATHLHLHHALTSVLTALSADPAPVKGTP